jgi:hypothetical protein
MKRIPLGVGVTLLLAGVLAACGSGSASPAKSSATPSPSGSARRGSDRGPAASGTIAEVSAGSIELQSQSAGQVTVTYTAKTAITATASTTLAAVTPGTCVLAASGSSGGNSSGASSPGAQPTALTAATVFVSKPVNGGCTPSFTARGGPQGSGGPSGFPRTGSRSFPSGARPSGGAFGGARADGKVTSLSGSTITVAGTNVRTDAAVTYTVTVNAATQYSEMASATAKALVVGKCAIATGKTGDTGAVAATSIRITPPTNGSCSVAVFGGRRPGGTGDGNG